MPVCCVIAIQSVNNNSINIYNDPKLAVHNSNVLYTDVWASMGQENNAGTKEKLFVLLMWLLYR